MSFSTEVKQELAELLPGTACCEAAQTYGLLEYGHAFSPSQISLHTENATVAALYERQIASVCGVSATRKQSLHRSGFFIVTVPEEADRRRVLERFGHTASDVTVRFNRANWDCDHCPAAYLRGAFLSCGAVTNPSADYHLEFSVPYYNLSHDLLTLLRELGFHAHLIRRKGTPVVYLKESEQIEDCLTLMGATNATLELMSVKMVKNIRNNANRITNCESANIDKTVAAAAEQVEALRKLNARGGMDMLSPALRELAELRLENPEMSLRELGEALTPPLSRSGVNHRLRRLMELAEQY